MQEHQQYEYKRQWTEDCLLEVCALANTEGGTLYVGVDDDGRVVGCSNTSKLLTAIPRKVNDALGMSVSIQRRSRSDAMDNQDLIAPETEKEYLEVSVGAKTTPTPVMYKGGAYRRKGRETLRMEGADLVSFIQERLERQWDCEIMPEVKPEALDPTSFQIFARNAITQGRLTQEQLAGDNRQLLQTLRLTERGSLTRAAVLLFHGGPERWFPNARVRIARYRSDGTLLYQDELHGSLLFLAQRTVDIVFVKYLEATVSYRGVHRLETYPYPFASVREAICNALIHTRYGPGNAICIRIGKDSLSITNDGELPPGYTPDQMREERYSNATNPLIGKIFCDAGFAKLWGRGISLIYEECHRHGIPEPTYASRHGAVTVTFRTRLDLANLTKEQLREAILQMLAADPRVTLPVLAERSGVPLRRLRDIVRDLKRAGELTREGSNRSGIWRTQRLEEAPRS